MVGQALFSEDIRVAQHLSASSAPTAACVSERSFTLMHFNLSCCSKDSEMRARVWQKAL